MIHFHLNQTTSTDQQPVILRIGMCWLLLILLSVVVDKIKAFARAFYECLFSVCLGNSSSVENLRTLAYKTSHFVIDAFSRGWCANKSGTQIARIVFSLYIKTDIDNGSLHTHANQRQFCYRSRELWDLIKEEMWRLRVEIGQNASSPFVRVERHIWWLLRAAKSVSVSILPSRDSCRVDLLRVR